jgi:transposase
MRPRRSKAASDISWPTPSACWSAPRSTLPPFFNGAGFVQDRDGAPLVIEAIHDLFPWLRHLFADSAYSGDKLLEALVKFGEWSIEIVRRMADTVGFEVLPRRWVVERTLAWLNRNRRLAKDFEASIESAKAWVYIASVPLLIRRLACLNSTYTIKIRTLSFFQIDGIEALGEPALDRGEKIACLLPFAMIAPQPGQARRRAQFQDFAFCARAMAMARSKCACAFAVSGSCDISAIFPAVRWISASHQVSLVVSAAVIASLMERQAASNCLSSAWARPSAANRMAIKVSLPFSDEQQSQRSASRSRPKPCRSVPARNLGSPFPTPSNTGNLFLQPERQALGLARLPRRDCRKGYTVSRQTIKLASAWRLDRSLAHSWARHQFVDQPELLEQAARR